MYYNIKTQQQFEAFQVFRNVPVPTWVQHLIDIGHLDLYKNIRGTNVIEFYVNNTPMIIREGTWIVDLGTRFNIYNDTQFQSKFSTTPAVTPEPIPEPVNMTLELNDDVAVMPESAKVELNLGVTTTEIEDPTPPKKTPRIRRPKIAENVTETD